MKRFAIFAAAVAILEIGFLLATANRVPDLAAIGKRVPGFHTTSTLFLHNYWRSVNEIEINEPQSGNLILNVDTGQVTKYQTPYLKSHRMYLPGISYLSPDRQQILRRGQTRWELLDSAGKSMFTWPLINGQAYWAPDGESWLLIDYLHRFAFRYTSPSA